MSLLQHTLSVQLIQVAANGVLGHAERLRKRQHFHASALPEYFQQPCTAFLGEARRIGICGDRVGHLGAHLHRCSIMLDTTRIRSNMHAIRQ
jgi:hypothetical protein